MIHFRYAAIAAALALCTATRPAAADATACIAASEAGQKLKVQGRLLPARTQLKKCASEECPAAIRNDCIEGLIDVDKRTPSLAFRARDPGGDDLTTVTVTLDGAPIATTLKGQRIPLEAGVHKIKFDAPGRVSVEMQIVVSEGEHDRSIVATLAQAASATQPPVAVGAEPAAATTPAPPATPVSQAPSPAGRSLAVGAYVTVGAGLAAAGVGAAFYVLGMNQRSASLDGACGTAAECDAAKSSIFTKLVVGDVLTGAGAAAVVSGVIWALVHYSGKRAEAAPVAPLAAVSATVLPGGGSAAVSLAF